MQLITLQVTRQEFDDIRECIHHTQIHTIENSDKKPLASSNLVGRLNNLKYNLNKQLEASKELLHLTPMGYD